MIKAAHTTVLLHEAVDALVQDGNGFYVDGTFGRGGHSELILSKLSATGGLLAMDKDPAAIAVAREKFSEEARLTVVHNSFSTLSSAVKTQQWMGEVSGVLLDLGVSSPQLDEGDSGFSFRHDGPLDMRMDSTRGQSVAEWLAGAEEKDIADVLKTYGEERYAKRIARAIVAARAEAPIERTKQLAEIVAAAHPAWEVGKHPATRSFLGLRLFINRELEDLEELLEQILDVLAPGGRLVVISFHSLEDRIVKRFMRQKSRGDDFPRGVPVTEAMLNKQMNLVGKAIKPSAEEVKHNPRSRSAVMRVAEKRS